LLPFSIDVVIIGPGPVEFKDTRYFSSMIKFFTYLVNTGKKGIPLDDCARKIADIFETEKPKTRYALVQRKFKNWTLPLLLPDRVIDRFSLKKLM
jgi:hypothetical protein